MSNLVRIHRALISVSDKTDLVPFARSLSESGVEIVSTGGTARALAEAGIDVIPVEQITGIPEMMDGRVKTLHPAIHGALLGLRDRDSHVQAMAEHEITPIDLVCINLYPFEQTILAENVTASEAIEQIDIGGPAMLRSAAKNRDFVTVVTSVTQYDRVINELRVHEGCTTQETRRDLAAAAFMRTAEYDTAISAWMCARRETAFPFLLRQTFAHSADLRYGENAHQQAAMYSDPSSAEPSVVDARILHGKQLSYNNIADAAAALELVKDLHALTPHLAVAAIIKHTNPCGAAVAETLAAAFDRAYDGDSLAAYGGILATNREMDTKTADQICAGQKFIEVIVAPGFADDAVALLGERWKNVRLLAVSGMDRATPTHIEYRSIPGGMLAQHRDLRKVRPTDWRHVAGPAPDERLLADATFAWTVTKHLKSNAVAISRDGQLIGAGPGQVDRVGSCRIAIEKAGDRLAGGAGTVAASDAFFPFADGPQMLIDACVTCLVHPGGSKRDQDTIDLCQQRGVTCMLTGVRHFRH